MLWLATKTTREPVPTLDSETSEPERPAPETINISSESSLPEVSDPPSLPKEKSIEVVQSTSSTLPPLVNSKNYKSIAIPDPAVLTQPLQLARALRPLARQVAWGLSNLVDEARTVDYIAETGVWQPILKPSTELWLDVALVFDMSPSMCLWGRLQQDLKRFFSRYGEFRDVRLWFLEYSGQTVSLKSRNGKVHRPKELLTGDRRRLVLVLSDCVSAPWHNGTMRKMISEWSAELPTVILQVFPERLWSRTALARSVVVELQSTTAGSPSNRLKPTARSYWDRKQVALSAVKKDVTNVANKEYPRLPVVSLDPEEFAAMANILVGQTKERVLGIIWDSEASQNSSEVNQSSPEDKQQELNQRIDDFILSASPTARKLATLLASAPVITLPVVRLIRRSLLPEASAVHIAEVFMSGLLKKQSTETPTYENAEKISYELVDPLVRERLRSGAKVIDAVDVVNEVSAYIVDRLGTSMSKFRGWLIDPDSAPTEVDSEIKPFLTAFATVTADVLRGLGGELAQFAEQIAPREEQRSKTPQVSDINPDIKTCSFRVAEFVEESDLELDKFEYTVDVVEFVEEEEPELQFIDFEAETATLTVLETDLFTFETATLEIRRQGLLRREEIIIQRQNAEIEGLTEQLTDNLTLKMVIIPAGTYVMGAPESEENSLSDERPQHVVRVPSFCMGQTQVTQAQWREVAGWEQVERELEPEPSGFKGNNRPVEEVSWEDAKEFCARLSKRTGKDYRLPSEAEWEYACRAENSDQSSVTSDQISKLSEVEEQTLIEEWNEKYLKPFYFGETLTTELANYDGNYTYGKEKKGKYREETTDVGSFPANKFGLYDMHGNVWEWCEDDYHGSYEGAPSDGSAWINPEDSNTTKVLRGGSWVNSPWSCRSASRNLNSRDFRNLTFGFRVVCSLPG